MLPLSKLTNPKFETTLKNLNVIDSPDVEVTTGPALTTM